MWKQRKIPSGNTPAKECSLRIKGVYFCLVDSCSMIPLNLSFPNDIDIALQISADIVCSTNHEYLFSNVIMKAMKIPSVQALYLKICRNVLLALLK